LAEQTFRLTTIYKRVLVMLREEWRACAVIAVANTVVGLVQLAEPLLFGRVVDALMNDQSPTKLILAWAGLGLFNIGAGVWIAVAADRLAHRQRLSAMSRAFEHAISLPVYYHAEQGTGAVVRTITAGASSLFGTWLTILREQVAAITSIIFLVPVAFWIEWRLALLLAALAGVYVFLNVFVIRKTSSMQAAVEHYHVDVAGRVGDVVGNVTVAQSYERIAAEAAAMRVAMKNTLEAQYPVLTWWGMVNVMSRGASTITMIAIFSLGSYLAMRREISIGDIVSFIGFAGLLIVKLDQLSSFISRLFMEAPTLRTYFDLLDQQADLKECAGARPLDRVRGRVEFEAVSFRYGDGEQGVFDIDITAETGQTIALVGATGAGKTTLMALLLRFRAPDQGRILIDGQNIEHVTLESLRKEIAVVFQDAGLFNRSIVENIQVGRPGAEHNAVMQAAELAQAVDFIRAKPGGMDFIVGERGASLSGGERQRVAIARAILKDAPILILDEATSALDVNTEGLIKQALDYMRKDRTTFIIAHRLSTVADADLILVMEKGRIVERGNFKQLLAQEGLFASLVRQGSFVKPKPDRA